MITMVVAFLVGAVLVIGYGQLNKYDDSDLREELAALQAENDKLKAKVGIKSIEPTMKTLPSAIPDKVETISTDVVAEETPAEEAAETDPAAAIMKMFDTKEARGFMKQMSAGFAKRGEAWIEQGIAQYTEKLNLSDAQVATLKTRLAAQMKEQTDAFNAKLDNEDMSMQEIMQEQREVMMGQEEVMAEILKEELDADQFAEFEREQLVEKTQRVQRDADRELSRLDRDLELTESQEDQVFGILVQTNSDYDESMAIEGVGGATTVDADVKKEDAIRSVLDEEQSAKYNQSLEQNASRRGRGGFGGFGGFGR